MATLAGELLHQKSAGPPRPWPSARMTRAIMLGHGEPDIGGQLLRLPEIGVGGLGQALAFERHHALIALGVRAAVDGHGEMPLAEKLGERLSPCPTASTRCGEKRA